MNKKKSPTEEGKDTSKGYVEIPMPELVNDSFDKGRVFQYGTARWAYGFLLFIIVGCVLTAATELPDGLYLVWGFILLPTAALFLISKYEIRHDRDGFSVCLGKRVLRRHSWSEVTAVDIHKRVFVNGKKLFAEPSMSGYEAFYDRAHAACKRKRQPKPNPQAEKNIPKPAEQQEDSPESKGYTEIDLSRVKKKLDDGLDRFAFGSHIPALDGAYKKDEGRLGLEPVYGKLGVIISVLTGAVTLLCAAFRADMGVILLMVFLTLLGLLLTVIGKYEIRFDRNGFSTRFGKRVLHEYAWSDVTDARDGKRVWVQGKLLLTDPTFDAFPAFYRMAHAACRGKGKPTPPSEKKRKSREKPPTKPQ